MSEEHDAQRAVQRQKAVDLMFRKHFTMTLMIVCMVVLPLLLFGGGGYLLDQALHTQMLWTIIGCLIAFVVTQVLNVYVFHRIVKK